MATTKKAEAPYIETKQGSRKFILAKLPASVVTSISYAATRGQSNEEGAVQRVLNPTRINSVKAFTLQGGDYPNAIVLNWVSETNIQSALKLKQANLIFQSEVKGQGGSQPQKKIYERLQAAFTPAKDLGDHARRCSPGVRALHVGELVALPNHRR